MQVHLAVLLSVAVILATVIDAAVDSKTAELQSFTGTRLLRAGANTAAFDETRSIPGVVASSDNAFKFLKLDASWDKLLRNPDFKVWVKYVAETKQTPEIAVIVKLRGQFGGDAKLSELLHLAKKLQNAQFELWFIRGVKPGDVPDKIFGYSPASWMRLHILTPQRQARFAYSIYVDKTHPKWFNTVSN
ncbi:hypothetical protein PHYSODRAFT_318781 [Phytophthora sojae]|uniref:RxLR effector protein n=1 Tax=Phytophthora sojae (strain P6497) TaxID=1094619 RepID=G5A6J9_PHYSP|nr:hypothetical protein PHYSODRAFT_318781 [Phytophthora sojae]EGZ08954.1 hypothetical protein PHYSODRAFT_318781 [Phytophthora sojae]|eukprot:XP_009535587.1 hypothetical protein PHYSODRAFT_318781 [Phytophthora sojae]